PVRACMTANVLLRFVLLYVVPPEALDHAAQDITAALADGALTELPVIRFPLDEIAAAQDAVEGGAGTGKVLVVPWVRASWRRPRRPAAAGGGPGRWGARAGRGARGWWPAWDLPPCRVRQGRRRCRSRGNKVTSRTLAAPVSRAVQRSSPIANPPCGG